MSESMFLMELNGVTIANTANESNNEQMYSDFYCFLSMEGQCLCFNLIA